MRSASVPCGIRVRFELAAQDHLLQPAVLPHIASDVRGDHSRLEHQSHAEAIHAHVVADRMKPCDSPPNQRGDQVFRNTAQAEAPEHDPRPRPDICNRRIR